MIQLDVVDDDVQARINEQIVILLEEHRKQIESLEVQVADLTARVVVLEAL